MDLSKITHVPVMDIDTFEIIGKRPIQSIVFVSDQNGYVINDRYLLSIPQVMELEVISKDNNLPILE